MADARSFAGRVATESLIADYRELSFTQLFYANPASALPEPFLIHEVLAYVFAVLTLLHAVRNDGIHIWLGFCMFSFVFETVGIIVESHYHPQFMLQVAFYVPLKEILWYAYTMWPSYFLASQLGLGCIAEACLMGLLQMGVNIPYETMGTRKGLQLLYLNPDFQFADLKVRWLSGGVMNILANLIMPLVATMIIRLCRDARCSRLTIFLAITLSPPICGVFGFAPFNMMKFLGCYEMVPTLDLSKLSLDYVVELYVTCMHHSKVSELLAWATALCVCAIAVLLDLSGKKEEVTLKCTATGEYRLLGTLILLQNLQYVYLLFKYDESSADKAATLVAYINIALLNAAMIYCYIRKSDRQGKVKVE